MFSVTVEYPCGQLPPPETGMDQSVVGQTRLVGDNHCPKGQCPWQVNVLGPLFVLKGSAEKRVRGLTVGLGIRDKLLVLLCSLQA